MGQLIAIKIPIHDAEFFQPRALVHDIAVIITMLFSLEIEEIAALYRGGHSATADPIELTPE